MTQRAALDVALSLLGQSAVEVAAWTGKPHKTSKRFFAYLQTSTDRWVVKASAGPDDLLQREHRALRELGARFIGTPIEGSVAIGSRYAPFVLVQPFVSGTSLRETAYRAQTETRARATLLRDCLRVVEWLRAFHALTAVRPGIGGTHGDLKPSNVIIGDRVQLIDWELFEPAGVQRHDLMHFLLYTGLTALGPDRVAGFAGTFLERTWVSDIVRECLLRYGYSSDRGLAEDLRGYAAAMLERRAALGLDNRGYFLEALHARLDDLLVTAVRLPAEPF